MNAFTNVFTDSVNFQDVDWWGEPCGGTHELDVRVLLEVLNDEMSYGTRKGWATRMYAWVLATEQEQYDKGGK